MARQTYCVKRLNRSGREFIIARSIDSLAEAAEIALRLAKLQEQELVGADEFCAEVE